MLRYLILPIIIIGIYFSTSWHNASLSRLPELPTHDKLLLVPLDSRPVCSTMVQKLGKLAGINVIVPPKELLDNYQEPADSKKLWFWLQQEAPKFQASMVSADILLHGSLLQTREHIATEAEQETFLRQLDALQNALQHASFSQSVAYSEVREKRNNKPQGPVHQFTLFSIIPRLLVSDDVYPDCWYQWHLMRYSQLLDMVEINGDYAMTKELCEYKEEIPPTILDKYTNIFIQSQSFNKKLLTKAAPVIIGQDDSSPFGLPHRSARQLENIINSNALTQRVQLTNGADEIAALLLTRHALQQNRWQPQLYVHFGSPKSEFKHMPYMAASVGATLRNQAQLVGAQLVETPKEADIILFVHCGDDNAKPTGTEAQQLACYLEQGKHVALIDLSANFEAEEMLLPLLLHKGVPINRLAAYAGWNTFSNSSGTALAQSILFVNRLRQLQAYASTASPAIVKQINQNPTLSTKPSETKEQSIVALYAANLNFTAERMLEDFYYQKLIHPQLRPYLESFGTTPTDLEPEEKQETEYFIHQRLSFYAAKLLWQSLACTPFYENASQRYYLDNLTVGAKLPWNRIFEVDLDVHSRVSCQPQEKDER